MSRPPFDARRWLLRVALPTALVFAAAAAVLIPLTRQTAGDGDEGFYALAAELVGRGRVLYRDFFYPQSPLWPYAMAPFVRLAPTYVGARTISALFSAGTATLLFRSVWAHTRSFWGATLAAAFFCFHDLTWQWLGSIRPYSLATLFMVAGLLLVQREEAPRPWHSVLAGVFAALAVGMRLLCLPAVPVIALAAALRFVRRPLLRGTLASVFAVLALWPHPGPTHLSTWLALGGGGAALALFTGRGAPKALGHALLVLLGSALVGLLVFVGLYLPAPEAFRFGNLGYHALRHEGGLEGNLAQNLAYVYALLGQGPAVGTTALGSHTLPLLVFSLVGLGLPGGERRLPALLLALLITAANLRPNVIFEHYFTLCVGPLCLCAGDALGQALKGSGARGGLAAAALLSLYLGVEANNLEERWVRGQYGPWNMGAFTGPRLDEQNADVRRAVARYGGPVLAPWPGTLFGLGNAVLPGFENHFGRNVAHLVPPAQRRRLHLVTHDDFMSNLRGRVAPVIVLDREAEGPIRDGLRSTILRCGYRAFGRRVHMVEVFVREPVPPPPGC